nr:zinc finger, C2H2-like protein [Tanacetum cinerariifolium]
MMKEKQVDIPILTPLLACYNVPAPIIHPPGVDPFTFLIKKPHCDQKMDIISPMDIDPCVVSRSECVARTYDLTASEHAGVNLSDPLPMVSTTSNSSAHSKTTTQPSVKDFKNTQMVLVVSSTSDSTAHSEVSAQPSDVVATPIQTESTPSIVCDGHKEGNTHLKNAQTLLFSSEPTQETESPIANDTLNQHPDNKKNQDLLQKEALAVVDSLFVCSIPDPGCHYQKIVTEDQMITPMCMDPTSMTKTNDGAQNGLLWCKICKVSCSSEECLERHILGKPHLKALKLSEQIHAIQASQTLMEMAPIAMPLEDLKPIKFETVNMDGNKPTWCVVCKVSCTSKKVKKRHLSGKKHLKNLLKRGKVPELPSTSSHLVNMTSVNPKEGISTPSLLVNMTKGIVVNPKEGNSTQCELCGVSCTSNQELIKHLAGQKHKKIVTKLQTLKRRSPAPQQPKHR